MGLTKLPFDATSRTSSTQLWALIVEENASSQMAARPPRGEKVDFMLFFVQVRRFNDQYWLAGEVKLFESTN